MVGSCPTNIPVVRSSRMHMPIDNAPSTSCKPMLLTHAIGALYYNRSGTIIARGTGLHACMPNRVFSFLLCAVWIRMSKGWQETAPSSCIYPCSFSLTQDGSPSCLLRACLAICLPSYDIAWSDESCRVRPLSRGICPNFEHTWLHEGFGRC